MHPEEAIESTRSHINDSLRTLYFAQDHLDISRPESQQLLQILAGNIVNDIERINLTTKTISANQITPQDEAQMQRINNNYAILDAQMQSLPQADLIPRTSQTWAEKILAEKSQGMGVGIT